MADDLQPFEIYLGSFEFGVSLATPKKKSSYIPKNLQEKHLPIEIKESKLGLSIPRNPAHGNVSKNDFV